MITLTSEFVRGDYTLPMTTGTRDVGNMQDANVHFVSVLMKRFIGIRQPQCRAPLVDFSIGGVPVNEVVLKKCRSISGGHVYHFSHGNDNFNIKFKWKPEQNTLEIDSEGMIHSLMGDIAAGAISRAIFDGGYVMTID